MRVVEGRLDGRGLRVGLVASRFNEAVVERLVEGAQRCLRQHGVADGALELVWVPGAMEVPLGLAELIEGNRGDALVALGAVIRGETAHFDHVARTVSDGVAALARLRRVPIGFGVLTVNSVAQAEERAGGKLGNKGFEAAQAAIEMVSVLEQLRRDAGEELRVPRPVLSR
ncbi:MAG: 6,7-dimethyl-8-ribityllumazine synthase [Candidatus Dormibacteria bacterium]